TNVPKGAHPLGCVASCAPEGHQRTRSLQRGMLTGLRGADAQSRIAACSEHLVPLEELATGTAILRVIAVAKRVKPIDKDCATRGAAHNVAPCRGLLLFGVVCLGE